jgi:hypothetical protein
MRIGNKITGAIILPSRAQRKHLAHTPKLPHNKIGAAERASLRPGGTPAANAGWYILYGTAKILAHQQPNHPGCPIQMPLGHRAHLFGAARHNAAVRPCLAEFLTSRLSLLT